MTRLDGPLRRELRVGKTRYTLLLTPDGLHLAEKGRRRGLDLAWRDLLSGDAALAVALRASVTPVPRRAPAAPRARRAAP